ncbi:shikimate dehydrogenase [Peribacillus huizhouensis]|uniref:Shikimate dehydrogenase (NADP(+)) n=1 Tax=Peribacillus huizhouensis TaxID=1501239 RepID=A0ABR6CKQ6_9BACI|nr:shikimate dehydrogenase [Peribacillus huizhouensis]MBA9025511.1 shikimate dehydrogenase [Peribacillus huizhouensis]
MKKVYGVIGDPIAHSISPAIQNDAFTHQKLDCIYHPFHITPENLSDAVKGMKAIGIAGFNVTIPHKTTIIPYLDEVDELAATIGAVNTVSYQDGKYIGYNTDAMGFYKALSDQISNLTEKKILVVGAGGAARAIYFTLLSAGTVSVDIANRTIEKAESLIADCPFEKQSVALTLIQAEEKLADYDVIIQTTSKGMSPDLDAMPISIHNLSEGTFVSDIIYNPLETKLLKEAKQKGCDIQNGLDMLVYQAALAFQIWTGITPDTSRMKNIMRTTLGGK